MTDSSLLDKAYGLRQKGNFKDSYDILREAARVADDPFEKASALLAGITDLLSLQDVESAKNQLRAVKNILASLDLSQASYQAQWLRLSAEVDLQDALILVAEPRQLEALAAFDSLIKKYADDLESPSLKDIQETIYAERAFILADTGFFAEALSALQELESHHSENPSLMFYLGYCHWTLKNHALAQTTLKKAISLGLTGNFEFRAHWALGSSLCETGDYGHARVELERARALATPYDFSQADIYQWLEHCCKQLGLTEEAEHYARLSKQKR